jgi:hypothetical protein
MMDMSVIVPIVLISIYFRDWDEIEIKSRAIEWRIKRGHMAKKV